MTPLVLTSADAQAVAAALAATGAALGAWFSNRKVRKTVEETRKQVSDNGHSHKEPTLRDNLADLHNAVQEILTVLAEVKGNQRATSNQLDRHIDDSTTRFREAEHRVGQVEIKLGSIEANLDAVRKNQENS